MSGITVTFNDCTHYQMMLLISLHDILKHKEPEMALDDCAPQTFDDYIQLVDELVDILPEVVELKTYTLGDLASIDDLEPAYLRTLYDLRLKSRSWMKQE